MRLIIQRVEKASVKEEGRVKAEIGPGLLLYVAIGKGDTQKDLKLAVEKIIKLRFFEEKGKKHDFQLTLSQVQGEVLAIPNYTLYGDLSEGNRPYFGQAANFDEAKALYEIFLQELRNKLGPEKIKTGTFGEFMEISCINEGPATLILDTAATA